MSQQAQIEAKEIAQTIHGETILTKQGAHDASRFVDNVEKDLQRKSSTESSTSSKLAKEAEDLKGNTSDTTMIQQAKDKMPTTEQAKAAVGKVVEQVQPYLDQAKPYLDQAKPYLNQAKETVQPYLDQAMEKMPTKEQALARIPSKEEAIAMIPSKEQAMAMIPTKEQAMAMIPTKEQAMTTVQPYLDQAKPYLDQAKPYLDQAQGHAQVAMETVKPYVISAHSKAKEIAQPYLDQATEKLGNMSLTGGQSMNPNGDKLTAELQQTTTIEKPAVVGQGEVKDGSSYKEQAQVAMDTVKGHAQTAMTTAGPYLDQAKGHAQTAMDTAGPYLTQAQGILAQAPDQAMAAYEQAKPYLAQAQAQAAIAVEKAKPILEHAKTQIQVAAEKAQPVLARAATQVQATIQSTAEQAKPYLEQAAVQAKATIQATAEQAKPYLQQAATQAQEQAQVAAGKAKEIYVENMPSTLGGKPATVDDESKEAQLSESLLERAKHTYRQTVPEALGGGYPVQAGIIKDEDGDLVKVVPVVINEETGEIIESPQPQSVSSKIYNQLDNLKKGAQEKVDNIKSSYQQGTVGDNVKAQAGAKDQVENMSS